MFLRILVALCSAAVIAAAAHVNVLHAGGYQSANAYLVIGLACLLTVGTGYAAVAWRDISKLGAALLIFGMLAGETWWLFTNADREYGAQVAEDQPEADARALQQRAKDRYGDAVRAKTDVDAAGLQASTAPACGRTCKETIKTKGADAQREIEDARAALNALPPVHGRARITDNLGVAGWVFDGVMGLLRSLSIMAASVAMALALHPKRQHGKKPEAAPATLRLEPMSAGQFQHNRDNRQALRDASTFHALASKPVTPVPRRPKVERIDSRALVSAFMNATITPDVNGSISIKELQLRWLSWREAKAAPTIPAAELGRQFGNIVAAIGLECEPRDGDVVIKGASFKAEAA